MNKMKKNTDKTLNKPAPMIHCSNPMSLIGRKMANILFWKALKEDKELQKEEYEIEINTILRYCNLGRDNKPYIDKLINTTKELTKTQIEWDLSKDGNREWGVSNILGSYNVKGEKVYFSIPIHLRELIRENHIFGVVKLGIARKLKSKYSYGLYENLIRYKGVRSSGYIEIEDWKNRLGITGNSYKKYNDFRKHIIDKAIKEINEKTDIIVSMIEKKKGNKRTHIKFVIKPKEGIENVIDIKDYTISNNNEMKLEMTEEERKRQQEKARQWKQKQQNKNT